MRNYQKTLFSGLIVIIALVWAMNAGAAAAWLPLVPCGTESNPCKLCHLWQLGNRIINFIIWDLSIPAATILIIAAGVILLISGGNENRVALGRTIFTNTVIGLVIVFCAWLLIDTLFSTLATGQFTWPWNKVPTC